MFRKYRILCHKREWNAQSKIFNIYFFLRLFFVQPFAPLTGLALADVRWDEGHPCYDLPVNVFLRTSDQFYSDHPVTFFVKCIIPNICPFFLRSPGVISDIQEKLYSEHPVKSLRSPFFSITISWPRLFTNSGHEKKLIPNIGSHSQMFGRGETKANSPGISINHRKFFRLKF